jgi:hypothetical protein
MGSLAGVTLQSLENVDGHNVIVELTRQPRQFEKLLDWLAPPAPVVALGTRIWRFIALGTKSVRLKIRHQVLLFLNSIQDGEFPPR